MADFSNSDRPKPGTCEAVRQAPVAGLLFEPGLRPSLGDLEELADRGGRFAVTQETATAGLAELACDGLLFDCLGLAPGAERRIGAVQQTIGLPTGFAGGDGALVTLAPAAELAGVARLLPTVRIMAWLIMALADLPGVVGIVWLPAGLAMSASWFADAVGPWLAGGPFPALGLVAMDRAEGMLTSRGLGYFTGQEFTLHAADGELRKADMQLAIRLIDWLVAHGRIDDAQAIELPDVGAVDVRADRPDHLIVSMARR